MFAELGTKTCVAAGHASELHVALPSQQVFKAFASLVQAAVAHLIEFLLDLSR
jgi:hypothetical protein